jgi:hypothetical protein
VDTLVEASPDYLARLFVPNDQGGFWTRHRYGQAPFEPQGFAVGVSLPAEVIEGQWIVRCPCRNAQLTSRTDKRFFCVTCLNADNGGQWVKVTWPRQTEDGEAVLLARPFFQQRNWLAGETVADLVQQNRDHGDPVPAGVA